MLKILFTWFMTAFIVVGGAIPYIFQYVEIHNRKNAHGFSLLVCLVLCIANILRILFWLIFYKYLLKPINIYK